MKEKFVMTSVFASSIADVVSTHIGLSNGLQEVGIFGRMSFENHLITNAYISRVAMTAVLIGVYALCKQYPNRFSFSVDKATRIVNVITWGAVALNMAQLLIK